MKNPAPRNRTIRLSQEEGNRYKARLVRLSGPTTRSEIENKTINQDFFDAAEWLPSSFVDLLFVDPPYNLSKKFGSMTFARRSFDDYLEWIESWFSRLTRLLKPTASVYVCSDWRSSSAVQTVLEKHLIIRNRITWEREKGRGSRANWKNCSEDIWFCTVSNNYLFNVEAVKLKRKVIAPYTSDGKPRDWENEKGGGFRLTHPSNLWTDLSVPFWSMPENTDHPTQKPEKLLAKIILASSAAGDWILDPFLGSGTTSAAAKKLGRRFTGIEIDPLYCCTAEKRLELAEEDAAIQGFAEGVFWERNTHPRKNESSDNKRRRTSA